MINNLQSTRTNFVLISFTVIMHWTEGQVHYFIFNSYPRYLNSVTKMDTTTISYGQLQAQFNGTNNDRDAAIELIGRETEMEKMMGMVKGTGTGTTTTTTAATATAATTTTTTDNPPKELPQSTMDILTITWYVATFVAIAAFFLLMLCSNNRSQPMPANIDNETNLRRDTLQQQQPDQQQQRSSLTPAPSYSEFAPPSYDTVIKESIYIIPAKMNQNSYPPYHHLTSYPHHPHHHHSYPCTYPYPSSYSQHLQNNYPSQNPSGSDPNCSTLTLQNVNFYTINELSQFSKT